MSESRAPVRLWDAPVRLIHWSLVILLAGLWYTGEEGEIALHKQLGYVTLALVVFRVLWGFAGSSTARFAAFVKGPGTVAAYVRGLPGKGGEPIVGHNPLGAWSVVALLLVLAAQIGFGLIAQDVDALESGPLSYLVSYETSDWAREWHHTLFSAIQVLVAIHIAAILFYLVVKRENLITPMITGKRRFDGEVATPIFAPVWRILVIGAGSAALAWWISEGVPLP